MEIRGEDDDGLELQPVRMRTPRCAGRLHNEQFGQQVRLRQSEKERAKRRFRGALQSALLASPSLAAQQ